MQTYIFYGTWKELTKTIKPLLYRWIVKEVIKENYISSYTLENKKLIKTQLKKIIFITEENIERYLDNNKFKIWL